MKCDELKVYEEMEDYVGYDACDATHAEMYDKSEVDAAIAELKDENRKLKEDLYKTDHHNNQYLCRMYGCDNVESFHGEIKNLQTLLIATERALWLAMAERYKMREFIAREEANLRDQIAWSQYLRERTYNQWVGQLLRIANLANKLHNKCLAKAEEYK